LVDALQSTPPAVVGLFLHDAGEFQRDFAAIADVLAQTLAKPLFHISLYCQEKYSWQYAVSDFAQSFAVPTHHEWFAVASGV
jgi:hypothetical protein